MSKATKEFDVNDKINASTDHIFQNNKNDHLSIHDHSSEENLVLDKDSGEIICKMCGRVITSNELAPEQNVRGFELDNFKAPSSKMYDKGLSTAMDSAHKDYVGRNLTSDVKMRFNRLRLLDNRIKSQSTSATVKSFLLLDGVKAKLAIPDHTTEKAAYLFRKVIVNYPRQARSYASMMLASLYAACKLTNTPRTMQEISTASDVKKRLILRDYRVLTESLDLSFEPYKPSEFVARICTGLGLTEKTSRQALSILARAKQDIFYGRNPIALAAAAVYISCKHNTERINQWKIASLVGISNVSLRNMYVLLKGNMA
ncbi:MAG: transcription initiation factor TFIIIB [Candidatus Nitrosotenuis sp.]